MSHMHHGVDVAKMAEAVCTELWEGYDEEIILVPTALRLHSLPSTVNLLPSTIFPVACAMLLVCYTSWLQSWKNNEDAMDKAVPDPDPASSASY